MGIDDNIWLWCDCDAFYIKTSHIQLEKVRDVSSNATGGEVLGGTGTGIREWKDGVGCCSVASGVIRTGNWVGERE